MTDMPEPPAQPGPGLLHAPVSVPLAPVPQSWSIAGGEMNDIPVAFVAFTSPMNVTMVALHREAALLLADQLRDHFGGIQVARDVPPNTNGQRHP